MDGGLYVAALQGSVDSLKQLLEHDASILDSVDTTKETPLHVAASLGFLDFLKEILRLRESFAGDANWQGAPPLHLACCHGDVEIVKELLTAHPDGCLVRDRDGWTPLHVAAMKGRSEALAELVRAKPAGIQVLTSQRETVLHLCVNHKRPKALKKLLEMGEVADVVNSKDENDNSILHLAVAQRNIEMIKLVLEQNTIDVNTINVEGLTPLDTLTNNPSPFDEEIKQVLQEAGAQPSPAAGTPKAPNTKRRKHEDWLRETKGALMIVAILIATVTYQAGLYPPGGVLQEDSESKSPLAIRRAGLAVLGLNNRQSYIFFTTFNTLGFLSSLSIILMLISGFPLEQKVFVRVLMVVTWVAVCSMALTYGNSFAYMTPPEVWGKAGANNIACVSVSLWIAFMTVMLLLGHFVAAVLGLTRWLLIKLGIRRDGRASYMAVC